MNIASVLINSGSKLDSPAYMKWGRGLQGFKMYIYMGLFFSWREEIHSYLQSIELHAHGTKLVGLVSTDTIIIILWYKMCFITSNHDRKVKLNNFCYLMFFRLPRCLCWYMIIMPFWSFLHGCRQCLNNCILEMKNREIHTALEKQTSHSSYC